MKSTIPPHLSVDNSVRELLTNAANAASDGERFWREATDAAGSTIPSDSADARVQRLVAKANDTFRDSKRFWQEAVSVVVENFRAPIGGFLRKQLLGESEDAKEEALSVWDERLVLTLRNWRGWFPTCRKFGRGQKSDCFSNAVFRPGTDLVPSGCEQSPLPGAPTSPTFAVVCSQEPRTVGLCSSAFYAKIAPCFNLASSQCDESNDRPTLYSFVYGIARHIKREEVREIIKRRMNVPTSPIEKNEVGEKRELVAKPTSTSIYKRDALDGTFEQLVLAVERLIFTEEAEAFMTLVAQCNKDFEEVARGMIAQGQVVNAARVTTIYDKVCSSKKDSLIFRYRLKCEGLFNKSGHPIHTDLACLGWCLPGGTSVGNFLGKEPIQGPSLPGSVGSRLARDRRCERGKFERGWAEVGKMVNMSADAAKRRYDRALEKVQEKIGGKNGLVHKSGYPGRTDLAGLGGWCLPQVGAFVWISSGELCQGPPSPGSTWPLCPPASGRTCEQGRRDLLDPLLAMSELGAILERGTVLVEPMGKEAWHDTLRGALGAYSYAFEDEALEQEILQQIGETADSMPLVQFALSEIWNCRDEARRCLTRQGIVQMGGIAGALERHADQTLRNYRDAVSSGLGISFFSIARSICLALTTTHGARTTKKLKELETVDFRALLVLEKLELARLVTRQGENYSLAHEALLVQWGTLRRWVVELREARIVAAELAIDVTRWITAKRDETLLWQGIRLTRCLELDISTESTGVTLGPEVWDFLYFSQEKHKETRFQKLLFDDVWATLESQDKKSRQEWRYRWFWFGGGILLGVVGAVLMMFYVRKG